MLADILGADLNAVDVPAASGRGAAMLGAQGAGLLDEAALLARTDPSTSRPWPGPTRPRTATYQHRFDQFRDRIDRLDTDTDRSPTSFTASAGRSRTAPPRNPQNHPPHPTASRIRPSYPKAVHTMTTPILEARKVSRSFGHVRALDRRRLRRQRGRGRRHHR